MKKNYFLILITVIALALSGLIIFQSYWMKNALQIKENQFEQQINGVLALIVKSLQQEETVNNLAKEISSLPSDSAIRKDEKVHNKNHMQEPLNFSKEIYLYSHEGQSQLKAKISVIPGDSMNSENGSITWNTKSYNTETATQKLHQTTGDIKSLYAKTLHNKTQIVENIVNKLIQSHLRINEKIDNKTLDRIIRAELLLKGLNIPYQYAVKDESGNIIFKSKNYFNYITSKNYIARLFPDDIFDQPNFLILKFPTQKQFIIHSMSFILISSISLTIIIIAIIAFALYIIVKQKRLSEIKTDFINNMTHEFKTPISTISLASQMLNDTSIPFESKNYEHLSKLILDESKRLGIQVEKVLHMAVFDRTELKLKLIDTNINELIDNILNNFNLQVKNTNGKIIKNLNAENPYIQIDEMHFTNVILNLLDNAIKYCTENPFINISTYNSSKGIIIEVKDNGVGISKENQKKVFEKFYRVHTGNIHNVKGFGLGLSYVKKITEAHRGTIEIESKPGFGSTFILFFPDYKK
jgi:signal transduction histidine kinase